MTRKPVVAGMFYDDYEHKLNEQIEGCFNSEYGPGKLPEKTRDKDCIGVVVPHAGYAFSGPCAAFGYKELAESKMPDLYVILGISHEGHQGIITTLEDFETPFGVVATDKEFGQKLIQNSELTESNEAHKREHSIEVQIPFLQFIENRQKNKNDFLKFPRQQSDEFINKEDFKILAIEVGQCDFEGFADKIVQLSKEMNKKICIIASSDFTHYGVSYGYVPFSDNVKEKMYEMDRKAIKHIENMSVFGLFSHIKETGATICGRNAIALAIEITKRLGAKKGELLKYYTSGDIVGNYSNAVGYGCILFR